MIDNDQQLELHLLIKAGDDLALAKLYDACGESIVATLRQRFSSIAKRDEAFLFEAISDAFMGYYKSPDSFDPSKSALLKFLIMAAKRDLLNILGREKRHLVKKDIPEDVEVEEIFWNSVKRNTQSADEEIVEREMMALVNKELGNHFSDETDITLAKLVLQRVRESDAYAEVLKIQNLPEEEQKKEVKRNKDRIKKVIERNQIVVKLKCFLQ